MRAPRLLSATLFLLVACSSDENDDGAGDGGTQRCTSSELTPGDSMRTLEHGGVQREYLVHVPASYTGKAKVPLVLDIHGLGSNAAQQKEISGWVAKSDQQGFVLVHPNGLNSSWNGGSLCCGSSQSTGVDDLGFMRALVKELAKPACTDAKRVYATGLSNGGAMTHLLACQASDVFASVAPGSMGNGALPCQPGRPISVTMWRATSDTLVPYEGGKGSFGVGPTFPSAQADFAQWKMLDSCTGEPSTSDQICKTYAECAGGVEVTLCTVTTSPDELLGGHVLYDSAKAQGAPVPDVAWDVFERHPLP